MAPPFQREVVQVVVINLIKKGCCLSALAKHSVLKTGEDSLYPNNFELNIIDPTDTGSHKVVTHGQGG